MTTPPVDSEVTTQLANILHRHGLTVFPAPPLYHCACGDRFSARTFYEEHVAAVLQASFVLVPKGQLHQEWRVTEDGYPVAWPPSLEHAQHIRDHPIGDAKPVIVSRLVGPWRPA